VLGTYAEFGNETAVLSSSVTFVDVPVVIGKTQVKQLHVLVTGGFCQNGCCSDGLVKPIASCDAAVWYSAVGIEAVAVDQQKFGYLFQLINGPVHGQERGVEDIYAVDLFSRNTGHGPGKRFFFNEGPQLAALFLCQFFGIVEQFVF